MNLNLAKCAFGVSSGKFLRFLISSRGIEANLEKIQAILQLKPPSPSRRCSASLAKYWLSTGSSLDPPTSASRSLKPFVPALRGPTNAPQRLPS